MLRSLGRRKFVSQSALATLLQEVAALPELPSANSRSSIKRCRDEGMDIDTPFGKVLLTHEAQLVPETASSEPDMAQLTFVNPLALTYHLCATCDQVASVMRGMFACQAPSMECPFGIIACADEVTPGNVLLPKNPRKLQCIYWTWKQHGAQLHSHERLWFVLGIARSDIVRRLPGKMSEYFKLAMRNFFAPTDIRNGMLIMLPDSERKVLFGDDEAALKDILDMKGASGTLPYPLCRNLVSHRSDLASFDTTGSMVDSTNLDLSLVEFHSDASIRDIMRFLKEKKDSCTKNDFQKTQQFTGWNYNERGALLCQLIDLKPASSLMWDWMHTYVSNGVWNVEVGLLLSKLKAHGLSQQDLHKELQNFVWPSHLASSGATGKNLFKKEQHGDVSCDASQALSLYGALRFILIERRRLGDLQELDLEITSYMSLCKVLDLLQDLKRQTVQASSLEYAILAHLQSFLDAYGSAKFHPKHHYATHLGRMYAFHRLLVPCFALERKHKEVKRYATLTSNITSRWERDILNDVLSMQFSELNQAGADPLQCGLSKPASPSDSMASTLRAAFGNEGPVQVSRSAMYFPGAMCSIGDVCLLSLEGGQHLGQIRFFAQIAEEQPVACVQKWTSLGQNRFRVSSEDPFLCELPCIMDTCVYRKLGANLAVVPNSCWLS